MCYIIRVIDKLTTKKEFFMSKQKNKFVQSREALAAKKAEADRHSFFQTVHDCTKGEKSMSFYIPLYKKAGLATCGVLLLYAVAIAEFIDDTYFYNDKGELECALFQKYWTEKQFNTISNSFCVTMLVLLFGVGANVCTKKMISKTLSNKNLNAKLNNALAKLGPDFKNIMKSLSAENPDVAKKLTEGVSLTEAEANFVVDSMRKYLKAHPNTALLLLDALIAGNFPADVVDRFVMEFVPGTATFNMAQKVSKQKSR